MRGVLMGRWSRVGGKPVVNQVKDAFGSTGMMMCMFIPLV